MTNFEAVSSATPLFETVLFGQQAGVAAAAYKNDPDATVLAILADPFPGDGLEAVAEHAAGPGKTDHVVEGSFEAIAPEAVGVVGWFDLVHVLARGHDFGNLLSTQLANMELHSAFRKLTVAWEVFTNNAGAGVDLVGEPALPANVAPLSSYTFQLEVSTSGPPDVDSDIVFSFDLVGDIAVPVVIQRIVLFHVRPEVEFFERLEFLTDIHEALDGSESGASLRGNPRQFYEYPYLFIEDEYDRVFIENLLFDWQDRTFGLPVWRQETSATQDHLAGATTIHVESTAYAEYRVGGFMCLFVDRKTFANLEIVTVNATSIVVASPTVSDFAIGTSVFPLRIAQAPFEISGGRFPVGEIQSTIVFRVTDNVADLADASAFGTYNGKVLLDDERNLMLGATAPEAIEREAVEIDGGTGLVKVVSNWTRGKRSRRRGFVADGPQEIWELRGLLHELKGRFRTFYVPTDKDDLEILVALDSGASTMSVVNNGYARFVQSRQPRNVIRITFVDGSTPLLRAITNAVEVDDDSETLTVDSAWPSTSQPADILRIEYVEKVRFASDSFRLRYPVGKNRVILDTTVRGVFQ